LNWLDIVIIVILVFGIIQGMRMGLLGAAINALALIVGWQLAGQLSDDIGGILGDSLSNDTIVTVISYIIIMGLSVAVARIAWKALRPIISLATLGIVGMVDRLGGVIVGLVIGVVFAGALIIVLARFTYNFEVPDEGIAGTVARQIPQVDDTRESIEGVLIDSATVPMFIKITDALPASALGFVPSDFKVSLDILERRIEG
jgi:membrane protein required for colicin V production